MMKWKVTTYALTGGLVGMFIDGIMIGVCAGCLVYIGMVVEKRFDS
ncbi:hypothetical protein JF544_02450 [Halobacillus kuroshimensis]|uniref:Uncharacterized protein n=1 Tax=Halobacillus kuroshimensis TaxID=302481 RepID=A0ABS3DS17_9BACI|nr:MULTISPECIES: hypothetical protein [Halobacillus]MBN8234084.1 hypothetical protein [Halobacillus kuroshimensis]